MTLRRNIPNIITSGNLLCGMLALLLTVKGQLNAACWMIPLSVGFDFCDGLAARALGVDSDFGVEFDSLGDLVSFGVAPSVLVYAAVFNHYPEAVGLSLSLFFTLCGALRLARFNVQGASVPKGWFCGLPIPAAGLWIVGCVIMKDRLPASVIAGIVAMSGLLMVSSVPFGNLKGLTKNRADRHRIAALFAFLVVTLTLARSAGLFILIGLYVISGLLKFNVSGWLSKKSGDEGDTHEGTDS